MTGSRITHHQSNDTSNTRLTDKEELVQNQIEGLVQDKIRELVQDQTLELLEDQIQNLV